MADISDTSQRSDAPSFSTNVSVDASTALRLMPTLPTVPVAPGSMEVVLLGTASMCPTETRNVSSTGLRLDTVRSAKSTTGTKSDANNELWLFDCGEGTQHQIRKAANIKLSKLTRVFITHTHGDHLFGLPGLMCTLSQQLASATTARAPLHIVGPHGLRQFVRSALLLTHSFVGYEFSVTELHKTDANVTGNETSVGDAPGGHASGGHDTHTSDLHPNELAGVDLYPDDNGIWTIETNTQFSVRAASVEHTVPTISFVVTEPDSPGKILPQMCAPKLQANRDALAALGVKNPLSLLGILKHGYSLSLPDESVIDVATVMGPPRPGRKLVFMGDTHDGSGCADIAMDATVVVHEATNAKIKGEDDGVTEEQVQLNAISHGHSTPGMAGRFAKRINANSLILTHFSSRYAGDTSEKALGVMGQIQEQAATAFEKPLSSVVTGRDLQVLTVTASGVEVSENADAIVSEGAGAAVGAAGGGGR